MSLRPFRDIKRRKTKKIKVGKVEVGGDALISVQSMTNTLTTNISDTVKQIKKLEEAGADIVRVSCPSCARQAFPVIDTVKVLEERLSHIKEPITLSIIGCVVNGPGEASQTQIGLTGGGNDNHIYLKAVYMHLLKEKHLKT